MPSIVIRSAEEVGLNSRLKDYADKLSGGQMRKLCIAIALIGGSKVKTNRNISMAPAYTQARPKHVYTYIPFNVQIVR